MQRSCRDSETTSVSAYDFTDRDSYGLVWFAYAAAGLIPLGGVLVPGLLYDRVDLSAGPLFWESMTVAMLAAAVPMVTLIRAWRRQDRPDRRRQLLGLLGAGLLGYAGAWTNAYMLAHDRAPRSSCLPFGGDRPISRCWRHTF